MTEPTFAELNRRAHDLEGAEDVIAEMMDAYWRDQAEQLPPAARDLLLDALDVFAENRRDAQVSTSRGEENGA